MLFMETNHKNVINEMELLKLENFIGYGRKDAEIIFFGLEEAGGGIRNLKKRLEIPDYDYLDCKRIHIDHFQVSKKYLLHSDDPAIKVKFQPVWRYMSYIMLKLDNIESSEIFKDDGKLLRDYQNNFLGSISDHRKTLLTEIYPIPCSSLKLWGTSKESYKDIIPFYQDKAEYRTKVIKKRVETFKELINSPEFKAKAIICYGQSHWKEFKAFLKEFDVNFTKMNLNKRSEIGQIKNTKIFLTPFFGNGRVSYSFLDELVQEIKK
jgi:hypothetical protein